VSYDWASIIRRRGVCNVVDVGANIGGFIPFWFEAGAERVIAVEPVPDVFDQLAAKFSGDARVRLVNMGASDVPGYLTGQNIHNCWTLRPEGDSALARSIEYADKPPFDVKLDTIDAICTREGMIPDFIKIDVDGYEPQALRGAKQVLVARPFMMLEISYLPHFFDECCESMVRDLFRLGYQMQSTVTGQIFRNAREFMRVFPWDTSFDVLLWPSEAQP
jgi:FkbM family methyltransferase